MKKAGDKAARQEVKSHCIYALSYQSYSQTFLYFLVIKYQVLRLFGKLYTGDVKQTRLSQAKIGLGKTPSWSTGKLWNI